MGPIGGMGEGVGESVGEGVGAGVGVGVGTSEGVGTAVDVGVGGGLGVNVGLGAAGGICAWTVAAAAADSRAGSSAGMQAAIAMAAVMKTRSCREARMGDGDLRPMAITYAHTRSDGPCLNAPPPRGENRLLIPIGCWLVIGLPPPARPPERTMLESID